MVEPEQGTPDGAPAEQERRYPSTIGGMFYLLVLATVAVAITVATLASTSGAPGSG